MTPPPGDSAPLAERESQKPLLEIEGLETRFRGRDSEVTAVDGVSLKLYPGETLGLVGESGSGKTVTSLSILDLLPRESASIDAGSISYLGRDLVRLSAEEMRRIRGAQIAMIFQEPATSLNPVFRTGEQVAETLQVHLGMTRAQARQRTMELYREVGIPEPERRIDSYPHEMSGGQKQRVMIAMALACNPGLLIADEPTTALDVTIQAQILDLLKRLRDERGMAVLFITHDLGVIAEIADRVAVMLHGKLVEEGTLEAIFENPQHPYTKGLLACRPRLRARDSGVRMRRLPTVADYMEERTLPDGTVEVVERRLDENELTRRITRGRARLLHPRSRLEALGYPVPVAEGAHGEEAVDLVEEGRDPLLRVEGLCVYYPVREGLLRRRVAEVRAVDGIDFEIYAGQTLGLVGESGCGKTTTGLAVLRLLSITSGGVVFDGQDLLGLDRTSLRALRRRMQIVLQDPYASLNPRMSVEAMLVEAMTIHRLGRDRRERIDRAARLLEEVGLRTDHLKRYPHEFSGGQRQRISIARALAVEPEFVVLDESVSALDVSVQAQVLNLLKDLQEKHELTYLFISHDLSVVEFMSDMMAVMSDGKIVEYGPSEAIYENPREGYTQRLIAAVPDDSLEAIEIRRGRRQVRRSGC